MRTLISSIVLILLAFVCDAQITNIKQGNWSDNTIWSNNLVPTSNDDVVLNFDIVVDINASCFSFNSNGHAVIINSGFELNISGTAADTLLARYVAFDAGNPTDTSTTIDFTYDLLKRNILIDTKYFESPGVILRNYVVQVFYEGNSRYPSKKIITTPVADEQSYFLFDTVYYFWQNGRLVRDSTLWLGGGAIVHTYTYAPNKLIRTINFYVPNPPAPYSDSATFEYLNGNITRQLGPVIYPQLNDYSYSYDNHPNPFYYTQNKLVFQYRFPFYPSYAFVDDLSEKNNVTSIYEMADAVLSSTQSYQYKVNGYPKRVDAYGDNGGYFGLYFYTH